MVQIDTDLRRRLKKPLGELLPFSKVMEKSVGKKVIAVGDEIVFNFLEQGKIPFISIFDGKTLRKPTGARIRGKISEFYPHPKQVTNKAGELNAEMFKIAKELLQTGGAIKVDGEEDLFALPFALLIEEEVVLYGQPGKGCVFIEKRNFKTRDDIENKINEMGLMLPHRVK